MGEDMAPDTANGRVTLARLSEQITAQTRREDEHHADLKYDLSTVIECTRSNELRIRDLEKRAERNDEQHKLLGWGQAIYTTVAAGLASGFAAIFGGKG